MGAGLALTPLTQLSHGGPEPRQCLTLEWPLGGDINKVGTTVLGGGYCVGG